MGYIMTNEQITFINKIADASHNHSHYNILPSLTIAMAIKESRWGKSMLGFEHYNFFGMKWKEGCGTDYCTYMTKEWDKATQRYIEVSARFRSYNSFDDGIKGYYDFLTSYKRYAPVIGEKNSFTACMKIQQCGWATSPTYGTSLYNDYVIPYNLIQYDNITDNEDIYYVKGNTYTLEVNLYVRTEPEGQKLKYDCLSQNAKEHAHIDMFGCGVLDKGTRVTCLDIAIYKNNIWIQIPSGWVCAINNNVVYIK